MKIGQDPAVVLVLYHCDHIRLILFAAILNRINFHGVAFVGAISRADHILGSWILTVEKRIEAKTQPAGPFHFGNVSFQRWLESLTEVFRMSVQHFLAGKGFTMGAERDVPVIELLDELLRLNCGVLSIHRRLIRRGTAAGFRGTVSGAVIAAPTFGTGRQLNRQGLRATGNPSPTDLDVLSNDIPGVDRLSIPVQPLRLIRLSEGLGPTVRIANFENGVVNILDDPRGFTGAATLRVRAGCIRRTKHDQSDQVPGGHASALSEEQFPIQWCFHRLILFSDKQSAHPSTA